MDPKEWKPSSIPFTRSSNLGPAKLPTVAEMRTSHAVLSERSCQTVVAVTPEIVVKFGRSTQAREGQTLLFLEKCVPQVPAPRLYAMFYDAGDLFLVMERIPGLSLDQIWSALSEEGKTALTAQLRIAFDTLRRVSCPWPSFFGSVDGGPVPHPLFYTDIKGKNDITGPFPNEQHFNAGLTAQYKRLKEMNQQQDFKGFFYAKHLDQVLCGHKPTFTHADVQRKNVVASKTENGGYVLTVVDWEDAGWYPDYWEYFVTFTSFRWDDDWCRRLEDFVSAWPAETAIMKMINEDLFF
ncbi:hypothetical protein LTR62_008106 [Meristemomyces frigidus]|uniref:Aminoglycoside phosphotransferase domain-containing protein n=1 Tax=Meristemomyces frigidus TaxID=1508187 RepID=A0AAN7TLB1_9PEZI|nr:hypothetical protein LTR62_008106 [Meristemomyces frigidus]